MHKRLLLFLAALLLLAGCGGGGSSSNTANTAQAVEKTSVRAHLDDVYLWNNEIVSVPSSSYATAPDYFYALLVKSRDRFSFSMPVAEAVSTLQEGLDTGYGVKWGWSTGGPLYAYYVDPNSQASVSVTRGTEVTAINGQAVNTTNSSYLISTLFPSQPGAVVNLKLRAPGTNTTQTMSLTSATYSKTTVGQPVILTLPGGRTAGYLLFNEHLFTSEQRLIDAMAFFKQQGVGELVLDMRYNPGGYLTIAKEVATMVGGATMQGKTFEKLLFNNQHPEKTADPKSNFTFTALARTGASLPLLGLSRVFVLTGWTTCSASESVINGLLPYLQVVLVGDTTCGKPYGFAQTNIGLDAYFAIEFEGVNSNGTDNYKSGFSPTCQVSDDLNYQLGDTREARLNAALYYMSHSACPPPQSVMLPKTALTSGEVQLLNQKPGLKLLK